MSLDVVRAHCAGLDVHKKTVVAHVITPTMRETRSFGTTTEELCGLVDWLVSVGVMDVAMESTGVYWKPVYNLLEAAELRPVVANARHIKAVPGRKTDVNDAEWIAELHRHGLLPKSFIPDRAQRELRELVRYRRSLIQERTREAARVQKVLEGANIKLASVASDVLGVSGRAMLKKIVAGVEDPEVLAGLARGRLRHKQEALVRALRGLVGSHQRLLLAEQLSHLEDLEGRIARLSDEIGRRLGPFDRALDALDQIPGIGRRTAEDLVAEIGLDMTRFPSAHHLASWAKICPGNHQSAGKSHSGHIGPGNKWLRAALTEAAQAATHTKKSYFAAQYHHLARRRGRQRAIIAVAHSILTIVYYLLRDGSSYHDLGPNYLDERARDSIKRNLLKRLDKLDFDVNITDRRAAA
jgi:transposase